MRYLVLNIRQFLQGELKKALTEEIPLKGRSHFSTQQTCPSASFLQFPGQKHAAQSQAHGYGHCSVAGDKAEQGRRQLDQLHQNMADSRAAQNIRRNSGKEITN